MAWRRGKSKPFSTHLATASRSESWSSVKSKSMCLPQDGLGDDVALHFVAATVDGGLAHVEVHPGQRRAHAEVGEVVALPAGLHGLLDEGQGVRADGLHHQLAVALLHLAALDLQQAGDVQ